MTASLTTRQHGRAFALQLLYARDVDPSAPAPDGAQWNTDFELDVEATARTFAATLVEAAATHSTDIDARITAASKNWRLDRMSRVDRNILRLATAELLASLDVPVRVVINEAVELAKRFGTAESGAFVNGLLDRIAVGTGRSIDS